MKKDMPREVVVRMGSEHSKRLMDKSAYTGNSEMNTRFITTKNGKHNDRRSTLKQYWKYYWNNHEPNLTCAA